MSRRLIDLCLLAYPRRVRRRDGDELRGLALELAEDHGILREAFGLLRGGLRERRRPSAARRGPVAAGAAATVLALTAVTWTSAAHSGRTEEDLLTCAERCADAQAEVSARVRDGWSCTERREPAATSWRCVLD